MIKAVIFDFDGILADTEPLHYRAWKRTLKKYGINLTKETFMKDIAGIGNTATAMYCIKKYKIKKSAPDLKEEKRITYMQLIKKVKPRYGAKELLRKVSRDFTIALATSSREAEVKYMLRKLGMIKYFRAIATANHSRLKPFPDIYLKAARKIRISPRHCVAIEDTHVGVLAAKSAGMHCIAAPNDYTRKQNFSKADMVVKSLKYVKIEEIKFLNNVQFR